MAFRLIQSAQTRETSSGVATTTAVDTTGANFLVAVTSSAQSAVSCVITDSKSNSWTSLTAQSVVGQGRSQIHYALNATVGSGHTFTATAASGLPAISVMAFSGGLTASAFDQQNGAASGGVTTLSTGSITPTVDNALVVSGFYCGFTGGSVSIDSAAGFTQANQLIQTGGVNYGDMMAYALQGTAAATSVTWRQGGSTNAAATIASFKPAPVSSGSGGAWAFS